MKINKVHHIRTLIRTRRIWAPLIRWFMPPTWESPQLIQPGAIASRISSSTLLYESFKKKKIKNQENEAIDSRHKAWADSRTISQQNDYIRLWEYLRSSFNTGSSLEKGLPNHTFHLQVKWRITHPIIYIHALVGLLSLNTTDIIK